MDHDGTHVPRQKRFTRERGAEPPIGRGQVFVPAQHRNLPQDQGSDQDAHMRDRRIDLQDSGLERPDHDSK